MYTMYFIVGREKPGGRMEKDRFRVTAWRLLPAGILIGCSELEVLEPCDALGLMGSAAGVAC